MAIPTRHLPSLLLCGPLLVAGVLTPHVVSAEKKTGIPPARPGAWTRCTTRPLPAASTTPRLASLRKVLQGQIKKAVSGRITPSAALLVAHRGKVLFRGAAGASRPDSIYDLASVTKVVATVTAVAQFLGRGELNLDTRPSKHLSWFKGEDKREITVRHLLLHTSGLHSVVSKGKKKIQTAAILKRIGRSRVRFTPGTKIRYSDIGFITLGKLVEAVSGLSLDRYTAHRIFAPLGMCDTGFAPPKARLKRVVTPWPDGDSEGMVYDPLSSRMSGIAGHAGLYSTVDDLGLFGQMMLGGGTLRGRQVLTKKSVRQLTSPRKLPGGKRRGLGWFVSSPGGPFSHGGFTGTWIWVDPRRRLVIVLLTNRTYIQPARSVSPLRRKVRTTVLRHLASAKRK